MIVLALVEAGLYIYHASPISFPSLEPPSYLENDSEFHLVVLGASTAKGSPYSGAQENRIKSDPKFEVPDDGLFNLLRPVQHWMKTWYKYSDVQVETVAVGGYSAEYAVRKYCKTSRIKPDVIVLYSGHNEWQCYYSLNMLPPPRLLDSLGKLKTGSLLLRRAFMSQAVSSDKEYRGEFFSRHEVPPYEVAHNKSRYLRHVEGLVRHCQTEGIFLVIVVPESNYMIPPVRSVYRGPRRRMAEAERMFKRALHKKYFEKDDEAARQILEEIRDFCSFAKLHFELGEIYYARQQWQDAKDALRRAMDEDGMPDGIKSDYQIALKRLAKEHEIPVISMNKVITKDLGIKIPDNSCFVDQCHFSLPVYEALSRRIMKIFAAYDLIDAPTRARKLKISPPEYAGHLALPEDIVLTATMSSVRWVVDVEVPAHFSKTRWTRLNSARKHMDQIQEADLSQYWTEFRSKLDTDIADSRRTFREWVLDAEDG